MVTTRRDFLQLIASTVIGGALSNCGKEVNSERTIDIDGIEYLVKEGVVSQSTKGDGQIKLGVMVDLHAHQGNSEYFADQLNKEGVDLFLVPGDLSHSFGDYEGAKDDYKEIISVVEPIADTGKLVLVTNGNHEQRDTYGRAIQALTSEYSNVVNLEESPVVDLDDLTIVALGGNVNPRFCVPDGFLRSDGEFEKLGDLAREYQDDKPLLVATHIPQKYNTSNGLDVIDNGSNVGGVALARMRRAIDSKFAVSGHIHEAFGLITPDEKIVKQGEFSDRLDFNPGAVYDHLRRPNLRPSAGILEFKDGNARAYILNK